MPPADPIGTARQRELRHDVPHRPAAGAGQVFAKGATRRKKKKGGSAYCPAPPVDAEDTTAEKTMIRLASRPASPPGTSGKRFGTPAGLKAASDRDGRMPSVNSRPFRASGRRIRSIPVFGRFRTPFVGKENVWERLMIFDRKNGLAACGTRPRRGRGSAARNCAPPGIPRPVSRRTFRQGACNSRKPDHYRSEKTAVRKRTISLSRAQSRTRSSYAEARNGRKKFNHFIKPSTEPNSFELCRGGKWSK